MIILESTTYPGTTDEEITPFIQEKNSKSVLIILLGIHQKEKIQEMRNIQQKRFQKL